MSHYVTRDEINQDTVLTRADLMQRAHARVCTDSGIQQTDDLQRTDVGRYPDSHNISSVAINIVTYEFISHLHTLLIFQLFKNDAWRG